MDLFSQAESPLVELLSTLSHEFCTPLAVIGGFSSTLLRHREHLSREEQQESLQAIQQADQCFSMLTDQLLDLVQSANRGLPWPVCGTKAIS